MGGVLQVSDTHTIFLLSSQQSKPQRKVKGARNFKQRVQTSIVGEFNRAQVDQGKGTCSNYSGLNMGFILIKRITVTHVHKLRLSRTY